MGHETGTATSPPVPKSPAQVPVSLEQLNGKVSELLAEIERLDPRLSPVLHRKGAKAPLEAKEDTKAPLSIEIDSITEKVNTCWSYLQTWHQELEV